MWTIIITATVYIILNLFVTGRINKSYYLNEERRGLHKKLIWVIPFLGPLMIIGFWRKTRKMKVDIMTKEQREKKNGDFYESGIGLNS
jgi:hypothetical protein